MTEKPQDAPAKLSLSEKAVAATIACRRLLDAPEAKAERPKTHPYQRRERSSFRVFAQGRPDLGRSVIVTRRSNRRLGALEAAILRALNEARAPSPRLLAYDGEWLIQGDVRGKRLSQALADCDPEEGEMWLDRALKALHTCQKAANRAGLARRVPLVDGRKLQLAAPTDLAETLDLPPPPLAPETDGILRSMPRLGFVKWDCRPGNAIVTEKGHVVWIDWEHACRGEPFEDLAWLLCDEWVPEWPEVEERLMAKYLKPLMEKADNDPKKLYLAVFATLHMLVRLKAILRLKSDGPWWDRETCLEHDLLGVTRETAKRLARRAARWADRSAVTQPMIPWLGELEQKLASLD